MLSVIIINWNTREMLRECLEHVETACAVLESEVIVVDNGSSDGSCEMVSTEFPQVRLFGNNENLGFPKAVNQGVLASSGDIMAWINSDVMVAPESLLELSRYLEQHPEVAAVGPQLVDRHEHLQHCGGFDPRPRAALRQLGPRALAGGRVRGVYARSKTPEPMAVDWISAACMVIRRSAVEEIGMLDESHFMYAEDTEHGLRLRDAGWQVHLVPSVRVIHYGGGSNSNSDTQLLWLAGLFRIAAGRQSRGSYAAFGLTLSAAFLERSLLMSAAGRVAGGRLGGVVSARDGRAYARTAFRLALRPPEYATELCRELERGRKSI